MTSVGEVLIIQRGIPMNMIDLSTNKPQITLPSPITSVHNLLLAAQHLHAKPEWRTHGSGDPKVNIKLVEARANIARAIDKLQEIMEEI